MKKLMITGLLLATLVILTTGMAIAGAISSALVEFLNPADIGQESLYNECTGEWIHLVGTFQLVTQLNIDGRGVVHIIYHVNPQQIVATSPSNNIYLPVGVGTTHANYFGMFPIQGTFTNNVIFVCPGTGMSMRLKITQHTTINGNGDMTADFLKLELVCGPGS
ncbi:MAG: hypothetical protein ACMUIU_03470 [bacterium]